VRLVSPTLKGKRGLEHAEIVLPTAAARRDINWARDRQALWNAAEAAKRRRDSRVAREYEVAVPHELTKAQRTELVREFSQDLANRSQVAVDLAIHKPGRAGDTRNTHAHILATTRTITATGMGAKASVELGDRDRGNAGLDTAANEITRTTERPCCPFGLWEAAGACKRSFTLAASIRTDVAAVAEGEAQSVRCALRTQQIC
jgi:ATP-dependent exoDNAse (exonuclease V) alpha subunit